MASLLLVVFFCLKLCFGCNFVSYYLLEAEEGKTDQPVDQSGKLDINSAESTQTQTSQTNIDSSSVQGNSETESIQTESLPGEKSMKSSDAQIEQRSGDSGSQKDKVPNSIESRAVGNQSTEATDTVITEPQTPDSGVRKSADKAGTQTASETREKKKKGVKVDTSKRKSGDGRVEATTPQSPVSPVFDENDFSYEEDAMPGKITQPISTSTFTDKVQTIQEYIALCSMFVYSVYDVSHLVSTIYIVPLALQLFWLNLSFA